MVSWFSLKKKNWYGNEALRSCKTHKVLEFYNVLLMTWKVMDFFEVKEYKLIYLSKPYVISDALGNLSCKENGHAR